MREAYQEAVTNNPRGSRAASVEVEECAEALRAADLTRDEVVGADGPVLTTERERSVDLRVTSCRKIIRNLHICVSNRNSRNV